MKSIALLILLSILFINPNTAVAISKDSMLPPIDKKFRVRVDFWKKVYTEIDSKSAFIHDKDRIGIIYKKVKLKANTYKQRSRSAKKEIRKIKEILRSIAKKKLKNLNTSEKEILETGKFKTVKEVKAAIEKVRAQYGLSDNYYIGLQRSHRYLDFIKKTFKDYGLPKELVYLPHVESSFNYQAYSKVGAAGIWQFMRSTGRLFGLKFTYVIDERRDPIKATVAAAKLLKGNYNRVKHWPLAITGYNHGIRSMERAIKKVGSPKISEIVEKYKARRFGFASKNFYATFIATVEISENPTKYFPKFKKPKVFKYSSLKLPKALTVKQILKATKLSSKDLKLYNPSIRSIAYRSSVQIPKGFSLQTPPISNKTKSNYIAKLKKLKSDSDDLKVASVHRIQRGDTLYTLSKIYRVSIHNLIIFNQITNPSKIYPGMKIKIPGKKEIAQLKQAPVQDKPKKVNIAIAPQATKNEKQETTTKEIISSDLVSLDRYQLDIKSLSRDLYQIVIETDETLGHYADWAIIRIAKIRRANRMNSRSTIRIGQKLKLRLTKAQYQDFLTKRAEYHLSIQEDFYQAYRINGSSKYKVRSGDNLNQILNSNEIPLWLFRQHQNKKFNINKPLQVGQALDLPVIEQI